MTWSRKEFKTALYTQLSPVQSLSHVRLFATPWTAACHSSLSITNSRGWLKLMSIQSVMPSNCLILSCPLLLLPSIFPNIRVFSNESVLCSRWPKYWSFSFSIHPCNEYSGLISFRIDWLYLLAFQGILKLLLQHHSSKASILWCSAFSLVQLSHPYVTTGKTIALTRQTFVGKVMSLIHINHLIKGKTIIPNFQPWKIEKFRVVFHNEVHFHYEEISMKIPWESGSVYSFLPGRGPTVQQCAQEDEMHLWKWINFRDHYGQRSLAGYSPRRHKNRTQLSS